MVVFGFNTARIRISEGNFTLPTIRIYFPEGRMWIWEYKHNNVTQPFMFWSGIRDWKLSELSGKSERSSYTIIVVRE